jgi:hypothetical protein
MVFSLLSNLKLHKEDNSLLATMISSQLQCTEMRELEDLITEQLPNNGHLHGVSLTTLFWPHHTSYQELGVDTQIHRQQGDLISLLSFFKIRKMG